MRNNPWTDAERAYLREHYGKVTHQEIADALGRPKGSIRGQVWLMRNPRPKRAKVKPPPPRIPWHLRDAFQGFVDEIKRGMCTYGKQPTTTTSNTKS